VTMTTDQASTTARTPSGYDTIWALFTDWCAVTGHLALPAEPNAVAAFLVECPCAPATWRRRVAAIDHHHAAAGLARPGQSPAVSAALGRVTRNPPDSSAGMLPAVQAALRALPSHGWTQGMFGRRDRCLLVLSQLAGVRYQHLVNLTAGDIAFVDGTATASNTVGEWLVAADDNPVLCGPCAITKWLRVLDVVMTKPSHRVLAKQIKDAEPLTDQSPHLCRSTREISSLVMDVPLLPSIDQWGYLPFPLQRLTPHSVSRLVQQMLAGDFAPHRHIAVDDETPEPTEPSALVQTRAVYTRDDAKRAWPGAAAISAISRGLTRSWPRSTPAPKNWNDAPRPC